MANIRALNKRSYENDLPRDAVTNTLHFSTTSDHSTAEYNTFAQELAAAFTGYPYYTLAGIDLRLYNLADTKPRPVIGNKIVAAGSTASLGNRDTALCLSFYADRNLPRYRGRIYCGPFGGTTSGTNRPSSQVLTDTKALGTAIAAAGGAAWTWCIWSVMDQLMRPVTNFYVDDEWDTMRSRGQKATQRVAGVA